MNATVTPLRGGSRSLSREERALVKSVPGLAERVVYDLSLRFGGDPRDADRVKFAHLGIFKAAQSYDPKRGPFATWAYFRAAGSVLDNVRKERKQTKMLTAGTVAGLRHLATKPYRVDDISPDATDQELFGKLVAFGEDQLAADLLGVVVASEKAEGEEELAERDALMHAVSGLVRVLDTLSPDQRDLLLHFAHDHTVKSIAEARRVDYGTLLDELEKLLELCRARLRGLRIDGVPSPSVAIAQSVLPKPTTAPFDKRHGAVDQVPDGTEDTEPDDDDDDDDDGR